jgi:hypothetical protein
MSVRPRPVAVLAAVLLASCHPAASPPALLPPPGATIGASEERAAFDAVPSGYVFVDIPPAPQLRRDRSLEVKGWAFEPESSPCVAIGLVVDRNRVLAGTYGIQRPDVAYTFWQYTLWWVGYRIAEPGRTLGRGSHSVYVVCKDREGRMFRSPATYAVNVK